MKRLLSVLLLAAALAPASSELLRAPQPPPHYDYAFTKFRPPPPPPEPTFFQRVTSWFFPWGITRQEEELSVPASPKIDHLPPSPQTIYENQQQQQQHTSPAVHVRDTEPTTARTTRATFSKCSPCNKVPWIPMMPTYQLPLVKGNGNGNGNNNNQQQLYFKHHFGDESQYAQVPAKGGASQGYKYAAPSTTPPTIYGAPAAPTYGAPTSFAPPQSTTPLKIREPAHQVYGAPPLKIVQPGYKYTPPPTPPTTLKPNTNTIDTSVITFTTSRPQNKRPLRFTGGLGAVSGVTNPDYIPPPNVLPLEGENSAFVPIPIPNLSPTPIPPLFDAKEFHSNPYTSQQTGFVRLVPLEPVAQLSSGVTPAVEVVSSNLVADFTLAPEVRGNFSGTATASFGIVDGADGFNATLNVPIVVGSVESNTDSAPAESALDFRQSVEQPLDIVPFDQLVGRDDDDIFGGEEFSSATTTDSSYEVKLEPSIQTAADLAEAEKKKKAAARDRETPLELLDSPIFHMMTVAATSPRSTTVAATPPPFKPLEDFRKRLSTLWVAATSTTSTTTEQPPTTTTTTTETSKLSFLSRLTSLPRETPKPAPPPQSTKKPKNIQIVIPYSTYHKPSPFKPQDEQEILTYRPVRGYYVTHPPRNIKTTVAVTSERIKGEETTSAAATTGKQELPTVSQIATELPAATSMTTLRESPKPTQTTTTQQPTTTTTTTTTAPPLVSFEPLFNAHGYHNDQEYEHPEHHAQESKIVESKVPLEPKQRRLTKVVANNIRDLLERERTPKPSGGARVDLLKLQRNIDGWTEQTFRGKASTTAQMGHTKAIPSAFLTTAMRTKAYMKFPTASTTLAPKTTFEPALMEDTKRQYESVLYKKDDLYVKRHDRFLDRDNELLLLNNNLTQASYGDGGGVKVFAPKATLSPKELWKRLHLTVSPLTNERVYVVTPLPLGGERSTTQGGGYKPRFAVRPTLAGLKMPKKLKIEASRRMDDTNDLTDVETVNGEPKVVKIITPERAEVTNSIESTTTQKSPPS